MRHSYRAVCADLGVGALISHSKRMFDLLGLRLGENHDAPLVPDAPDGPIRKKRKTAAPARIS